MACLGPGRLNVGELDFKAVVMDPIVSDVAGEVDNSMIKDRVGRRIAQIDAGQARVVIDLECHGAAETLTDGLDLRNGGAIHVGGGRRVRGYAESAGRHYRAGRQDR